jgi:hypothetical protein
VLRRHRLRRSSRWLAVAVPYAMGLFFLGGVLVFAVVVIPRAGEVAATTTALDVAAVALYLSGVVAYAWMYRRTVREVVVWSDGDVKLRTILGGRRSLAALGGVVGARIQQFLPQPGYVRVATETRVLYVGPFEDRDAVLGDLGVDVDDLG